MRRAIARAESVPAAWRELGGRFQSELDTGGEAAPARIFSREVSLDAAATADATPLRIEVDTRSF
jgi:hypothetical protein